jgi:hypothetical protein
MDLTETSLVADEIRYDPNAGKAGKLMRSPTIDEYTLHKSILILEEEHFLAGTELVYFPCHKPKSFHG